MRGGALPPALLACALALCIAVAPRRSWAQSGMAFVVATAALSMISLPVAWIEAVFLGCWASIVVTAASVHMPHGPSRLGAMILSFNAGVWLAATTSLAGRPRDLLISVPCALLAFPASLVAARFGTITLKVVSSWLIAVAMLCAALPFLPVTPGYVADHLE